MAALKDTPSLRREVTGMIACEREAARTDVAASPADCGETPRVDVGALAFTEREVVGDWMP